MHNEREAVGQTLAKGAARASAIAAPTLLAAQRAVGLHV
jgi:tryptophanyl-tRNA synthetase